MLALFCKLDAAHTQGMVRGLRSALQLKSACKQRASTALLQARHAALAPSLSLCGSALLDSHSSARHGQARRMPPSTVHPQQGVPLELVKYDTATGKFIVGQEALRVLRDVRAPLGVVAVCGRARQGKSFILNQLLQTTGHGFTVGPTHRPCTKGLWMWSAPQRRVAADGSESYLVSTNAAARVSGLIAAFPCGRHLRAVAAPRAQTRPSAEWRARLRRCCWTRRASTPTTRCANRPCALMCIARRSWTGARRFDFCATAPASRASGHPACPRAQTAQYSTQIFSLAVLLSCLFVYNHMGGIDESALDRLSLVTEMTKHIRVKAGQGRGDAWAVLVGIREAAILRGLLRGQGARAQGRRARANLRQGGTAHLSRCVVQATTRRLASSRPPSSGCCATFTSSWRRTAARCACATGQEHHAHTTHQSPGAAPCCAPQVMLRRRTTALRGAPNARGLRAAVRLACCRCCALRSRPRTTWRRR